MDDAPADAADGGPPFAPWLPARKRSRCRQRLVKLAQVVAALFLLLYILVTGLLLLVLELPKIPVRLLMKMGMQGFGMIVEHAYALPICKLHVTFSRLVQRTWNHRPFHTRYADIRTEIPLASGGVCFVHAVPCMTDNFSYLLVDATGELAGSRQDRLRGLPACVVDPCDALAVVEALEILAERYYAKAGGLRLEAVLCTHRHWDHAGGNQDLIRMAAEQWKQEEDEASSEPASSRTQGDAASRVSSMDQSTVPLTAGAAAPPRRPVRLVHPLRVYGGANEGAPGCTHKLWHGSRLQIGTLTLEALASPGHTEGSLMFRLLDESSSDGRTCDSSSPQTEKSAPTGQADQLLPPRPGVLFTGDTLFSGGCGAQFEGCELDIEHCFATVLACCDSQDALLFPGHEYTCMLLEQRLNDAMEEWAGIEAPGQFLALCGAYYVAAHRRSLRDKVPTVPFMLKSERLINPHFDRGLLRHADVIIGMLEAQRGARAIGEASRAAARSAVGAMESLAQVAPSAPLAEPGSLSPAPIVEDRQQPVQPARRAEAGDTSASALTPRSTQQLLDPTATDAPERTGELPLEAGLDAAAAASGAGCGGAAGAGGSSGSSANADGCRSSAARPAVGGGAVDGQAAPGRSAGYFATGGAAPAYQFAFLYKQELDALREELEQERLSGPEAAARLLEAERRLFSVPLLTGPSDAYCGEGVEPWEEEAALSDDEGQVAAGPGAPADEERAVSPPPSALPQESEDTEDQSEEASWDGSWPSETLVTNALKVLGVPPEVPVGPKAPCADEDLPVSLQRLETVMRRLHVSEEHLEALQQVLQKEVDFSNQASSVFCSVCVDGGQSGASGADSQRRTQAVNTEEASEVLPLRQVLQMLRPTPLQERSSTEKCIQQTMRCMRRFRRDCASIFNPPSESHGQQPEPSNASRASDGSSQEKDRGGSDIPESLDFMGKRRRAVERVFTAHALDKCALCSCAFNACSASCVRRRPVCGTQD